MIRSTLGLTAMYVALSLSVQAQTSLTPAVTSPTGVMNLETAISKALQGSPAIAAATASLSAADGTLKQSGLLPNPEIGIDAENVAGSGPYRGTDSAEYTYSLSQKVEIGGKRGSRRGVAGAERTATQQSLQATKLDITRDVTIAYGEVLAAGEKLELVKSRENLAREVLANVGQRVGAARDPLIYKNQAEVALATTTLELQKTQRDLVLAKRKLASFWGDGILSDSLDPTVLDTTSEPEDLSIYQAKLGENPDLQRMNSLREAREATLRLEKAQGIPDPTISVGLRNFRENREQAMLVGMSLPIPVFDRNQGNISRAGAEVLQAEQEVKKARLEAEQALNEAWQDWQSAHNESTQLQKRIIPSAEEALKLSRQGYERGRFSFLEVLNAQRTLAEAQEQQINAEQRQLNAKAVVERLTAGPSVPNPISTTIPTGETK
ncbi:MAG: TolC family protein [Blastochloris viridis]|uniref:TolC family protein n=1 Tax=Blastochloris viridis TaxID=1079 RepID=A0A6N4RDD9_BLAVI|nr:MAG: TolC family protein [Blastochloris viridis]